MSDNAWNYGRMIPAHLIEIGDMLGYGLHHEKSSKVAAILPYRGRPDVTIYLLEDNHSVIIDKFITHAYVLYNV